MILAVELDNNRPKRAAVVNVGHHDPTYDWAKRRNYYTDISDGSEVIQPDHPAVARRAGSGDGAIPPTEFDEWMLFLPGAQSRLVTRYHRGAARIRGAAGTGKTVIALHRAAELGRRYEGSKILFTTFSRSLCSHLRSLFERLPDPPGNVEIVNIDRLASTILGDAGGRFDRGQVDAAFDVAFEESVPSALAARLGNEYLREEIKRVIKGRAATREEYLDTGRFERVGRLQSLKRAEREICWNLLEAWDRELRRRAVVTFEDRLVRARNHVWEKDSPRYRSAIVDEGQDMTLVGVQLVRGLVAGKPERKLAVDALLVLDDSAQRIYPGGFKPAWANLDFSGYSDIIRVNYRNSRAIFSAARIMRGEAVVAKQDNDDGSAADVEFEREEGIRPDLSIVKAREVPEVLRIVRELVESKGYAYEEIAVLSQHNRDVDALQKYLHRKAVPCSNLSELRSGPLGEGVRVGTFDRAKGLEFRAVLLVRLGKSRFPPDQQALEVQQTLSDGDTALALTGTDQEQRQLHLDRLYAAMTRARDRLFLIADEEPCEEILRAFPNFGYGRQVTGF